MSKRNLYIGVLSFCLMALATQSYALPPGSRMIAPPVFGVLREVIGATLPVVKTNPNCAGVDIQGADAQKCFTGLKPKAGETMRILVTDASVGVRLSGQINRDFQLYDLSMGDAGLSAKRRELATSDIKVPRDCFAIKDEPVGYEITNLNGQVRAEESQIVVCGGGTEQRKGPYRVEGVAMPSDPAGWPRSETTYVSGTARYLAVPDAACPAEFRVKETHCAKSGITYLLNNPSLEEVDLIASKGAITGTEVLEDAQTMQWVLKRRSSGFKADSRWIMKSTFSSIDGCDSIQGLKWHVSSVTDGYQITEKVLSRCGARMAPTPTAIYEVYGQDYFIINCSWSERASERDPRCKQEANDYLNRTRKSSGYFVIVTDRIREGDRLYGGGYVRHTYVRAELTPNDVYMISTSLSPITSDVGCSSAGRGGQADGFEIVRAGGVLWARRYQHMACAVY